MKIFLDTCISPRTRDELLAAGHKLDKDFGELAIALGRKHAGIVRLVDIPVRKQALKCMRAVGHYGYELLKGAIVTVEPGRVRVRPHLPDPLDAAER